MSDQITKTRALLADLVDALDNAYISSWQTTAGWQKQLDDAREFLASQGDRDEPR